MTGYKEELPTTYTEGNCFDGVNLFLIDYGFATAYKDKITGKHLPKQTVDNFRGNMVFASQSQMHFYSTARRDDIISVTFLLLYLLRNASLLNVDLSDKKIPVFEQFKKIRKAKD
jgi:hypothetical protein